MSYNCTRVQGVGTCYGQLDDNGDCQPCDGEAGAYTNIPRTMGDTVTRGGEKTKTYSTEQDDPNYSEFTPSLRTMFRTGLRRRRRRNDFFQFKQSCLSQASLSRFSSPMERRAWIRKCMAKHLHKQEGRILPLPNIIRPTTTPQGYRIGQPCSVNNREGYNRFRCMGRYNVKGKCSPCEDDVLPRQILPNIRSMGGLNRSNRNWHYPSTVIGRNYEGIRRGYRGKLFGWNLGMGKAQLKERLFSDNPHKYDWGYGG